MFRKLLLNLKTNKSLFNNSLNNVFCHKFSQRSAEKVIERQNKLSFNAFVSRTHTCGQLCDQNVGQSVRLCGWIQYQRLGKFVIIRDSYGLTQIIVLNDKQMQKTISKLRLESVVQVIGRVVRRPDKDINPELKTGSIEVIAEEVVVLNECREDLPFIIREDYMNVNEKTRLEFRYIDLRHPRMQSILRLRSKVINKMRQLLTEEYGFVEVETPTLFKSTPGGAKEFVVPTQLKDCFYNLVQSPQQFKQLLMIGGIDRYFQIARCYRNEGSKPDRQPEFTQLDLEMSFTTADGVMALIEELIQYIWPQNGDNISIPFQRMTFADAFKHYGTDKPDLRSDIKIKEIDLKNSWIQTQESDQLFCLTLNIVDNTTVVNEKLDQLMEDMDDIQRELRFDGKLFYKRFNEELNSFNIKEINESLESKILNEYHFKNNDLLWVAIGSKKDVYRIMGRIRADCVELIEESNPSNNKLSFLWITDFPLFDFKEDSDGLESSHHPFTAPVPQHNQLLYTDPLSVLGQHFDLVLNGQEVGGGSIRIHDHKIQEFVLKDILKEDIDSMKYFLDALRSGCPPHGGIALGLDRLLAIMCGTKSIRDVMAFPKSGYGKDLMAGSPALIPDSVKKLYHLK